MNLNDPKWRINNLYNIIDRDGNCIKFKMNEVQDDVYENLHTRNIILKARQIGMSTFSIIYFLDQVLFTENLHAGIVSYSMEHSQHILKKIVGHALDTLAYPYKNLTGIIQRSAREIRFNNGSSLRVDTTLRGGSYPLVLVSEFGKTCARNPSKAEEIITGTLQTVPVDGTIIIESTAEGSDGFFAEMTLDALQRGNDNLTNLDYKLFFYGWTSEKSYQLENKVNYDVSLTDYFNKIEDEIDEDIAQPQRNWYALQKKFLGEMIKREYPSTPQESFLSSSDAFYFAEGIAKAYSDNRCLNTSLYDALLPVYISLDLGVNDLTVMIFFQIAHGEIRVIDYYADKNKDVPFYAKFLLQDKPYLYHTIFLPHDAVKRDNLDINNSYERDFKRLFTGTNTRFHVLQRMDKQLSISHARIMLDRCVFNINRVKPLLDNLCKYRKKWSEPLGKYLDEPLHTEASNYGDAFQYLTQAVSHMETVDRSKGAFEQHKKVVDQRSKRII